MTIRRAVMSDLEAIYALGEKIHALSADRDVPMDEVMARTRTAGLIASKMGCVLVDEVDGKITGLLIGYCEEMFFSRARYAMPLIAYAERRTAFVWMVKRFVKWAFEQKHAVQVVLDTSFGGPLGAKTEQLYNRLGIERLGSVYIMRGAT